MRAKRSLPRKAAFLSHFLMDGWSRETVRGRLSVLSGQWADGAFALLSGHEG